MELQEFAKENIDCKEITFMDNQDSAELIGTHIFQILDDQCKIPNSTDQKFAAQVHFFINSPYIHTYIHTFTYTYTCAYIVHTKIFTQLYIHTHTYIHTYTSIHTYIHT